MTLPAADDLLKTSRDVLIKRLLPALPDELRYELRMIANSMSIAERTLKRAHGDPADELAVRQMVRNALNGEPTEQKTTEALCNLIRQGSYDVDDHRQQRLLAGLRMLTTERLLVSNPKELGRD